MKQFSANKGKFMRTPSGVLFFALFVIKEGRKVKTQKKREKIAKAENLNNSKHQFKVALPLIQIG